MDFVGLIPVDNREQNKQLLGQVRDNVDQYINSYRIEITTKSSDAFQGASSIVFAVDGMQGALTSFFRNGGDAYEKSK